MAAPISKTILPTRGQPNFVVFTGSGTIKEYLDDYGIVFDAEVEDDTVHAMIIDPRFSTSEVESYIVEKGGTIYVPPTEST